jgi:hypothetical protein
MTKDYKINFQVLPPKFLPNPLLQTYWRAYPMKYPHPQVFYYLNPYLGQYRIKLRFIHIPNNPKGGLKALKFPKNP